MLFCKTDLIFSQWIAVGFSRVLFVRAAITDVRWANDKRRLMQNRFCHSDRMIDLSQIVWIRYMDDMPVIRLIAFSDIFRKRNVCVAVDRNAIVVVEGNKLSKLQMSGKRGCFARDAFLHAAIAHKDIRMMVHDRIFFAVECTRQKLLGDGFTDSIRKSLS